MHENVSLWLIDENHSLIGEITNFTSLQWIERYYTEGEFELVIANNSTFDSDGTELTHGVGGVYGKIAAMLMKTSFIYRRDKRTTAIIDWLQSETETSKMVIKGYFIETILKWRALENPKNYTGTTEEIVRKIVDETCINPTNTKMKIPNLRLGAYKGLGINTTAQYSFSTVYDVVNKALQEQELSFRIDYDISQKEMIFEVFQGTDRTQGQTQNTPCVFSRGLANVIDEIYSKTIDNRNYAIIIGEEIEGVSKLIYVDNSNGNTVKAQLVDAKRIKREPDMNDQQYRDLLISYGNEKLAEYNIGENIKCKIDVSRSMFFEIGDKATYVSTGFGVAFDERITEIWETVENNNMRTDILIGTGMLNITQKIKRGIS